MSKEELKVILTELLTSDEVKAVIEYTMFHGENIRASWYDRDSKQTNFASTLDSLGIHEKIVEQHGGEGEGDMYYSVWSFTKDSETVYVQFDGSYQSYNGAEFDSWFFVEPESYTAIRYNKV